MNWFDYAILGVIFLSVIISFFRGFLRETISLLTWVVGLVVALRYAPGLSSWLDNIIKTQFLRYLITFILLFIGIFIVGLLINTILKRALDASGMRPADRLLGSIFGAARGTMLVAVVLMFMTMTAFNKMAVIQDSKLSPTFMPLVTWLDGFLPQQLQRFQKWAMVSDDQLQPMSETSPDTTKREK